MDNTVISLSFDVGQLIFSNGKGTAGDNINYQGVREPEYRQSTIVVSGMGGKRHNSRC